MMLTALLIPRIKITSIFGPVGAVVGLAFINAKIWDAALFFSIPNSLSLQALSLLVANGLIFWVLVKLLPGIEIEGILPAIFAPVVFTICSLVISKYAGNIDWAVVIDYCLDRISEIRGYFQAQRFL